MTWTIRALGSADLDPAHALRQQGLRDAPAAFGAAPDDPQEARAAWAELLAGGLVYGGFDAAGALRGIAALGLNQRGKLRHKAHMWGVYVEPGTRGRGLARALAAHIVAEARRHAERLTCAVATDNAAALRLYESLGFARYGTEPAAMRVDGRDVDNHLLTLRL